MAAPAGAASARLATAARTAGNVALAAVLVVVRVDRRVLGPLVRKLVLGEAGIHRAGLDAGVAVDALLGVDVELLDTVVVGLVGGWLDAVHRAHLDARVVLLPDAGLSDHVGHMEARILKDGQSRPILPGMEAPASWLCPTEPDRARLVEASERLRRARA